MSKGFYRAFEDRYRGSREEIKSRLRVYLPFIVPLYALYQPASAVDMGCGRGEWLELLQGSGFDAQGIDLDDGMLATCRELGLKVQMCDAIGFLKGLPQASQVVVSGFHFVEHISFSDLQALVQEAFRVLKPAGLLILETPNPENIVVASANFYLDPTHIRPIPPQLLSFLPEYYGFKRVNIMRLQEPASLANQTKPTLMDVLGGVSPDYAIVAQKDAKAEHMMCFDEVFEKNYGLALETLAQRYEERILKAEQAEATLDHVRSAKLWRVLRWINNGINKLSLDFFSTDNKI